jgi:uncharacterized protein YhdP
MSNKLTFFSWLWHAIYFIFAHLPARIIANILLYLAVLSLLLHFASYYIEQHPQNIEKFVEQYLLFDIKFSTAEVHYNLLKPSIKLYDLTIFKSQQNTGKDKTQQLHFNSASISINLLKSLMFLKPDIEFINLDGFKTSITRHKDQSISIGSLNLTKSLQSNIGNAGNLNISSSIPLWVLRLKSFSLTNTQLVIKDNSSGIKKYILDNIHIKMTNKNEWTHSLSIAVDNFHPDTSPFPLVFEQIKFTSQFKGSIYNLNEWNGKFFIDIKNINYKTNQQTTEFIKKFSDINLIKGVFSGSLWGVFSQFTVSELIAKVKINDLKLQNYKNNQQLQISQLDTLLKLNENQHFLQSSRGKKLDIKNWLLSLYQLNLQIPHQDSSYSSISLPYTHLNILKKAKQFKVKSYIDKLPLEGLGDLLQFTNKELAENYQGIKPSGSLSHFNGQFTFESKQIKQFQIYSKLNQISAKAWQQLPQFKNLSARLWFNNQHGFVNLDSSNFDITLKPLFRYQWQFEKVKSMISWQHIDSQWWINADNTVIQNDHLSINGNAQFWLSNNESESNSPLMLINAYFNNVDASYVPLYLPADAFSQVLTDWLDHAFVAANVPDGGVLFRGRLAQFPYPEQNGLMDITFHAEDMQLNYFSGWPQFEHVKSEIQFTETGLFVDVENVQLYNSYSHDTQVELKDYLTSDIKIYSKIKTNATDTFNFLQKTDLVNESHISQLKSKGKVNLDLLLTIPADDSPVNSLIKADFNNLIFSPKWLSPQIINTVKGKLTINNNAISSQKLTGLFKRDPLQVAIKTISKKGQDKTSVTIDGSISTESIKDSAFIPESLTYLFSRLKGTTPYKAKLQLTHRNGNMFPDLFIQSNLKGVESSLPEPLNKNKNQEKYFSLHYKEDAKQQSINVNYSDILSYCSQSNFGKQNSSDKSRVNINFMSKDCLIPFNPIILLTGKLDLSSYSQWQTLLSSNNQITPKKPFNQTIEFDLQELKLPTTILDSSAGKEASAANSAPVTGNQSKNQSSPSYFAINGNIENLIVGKSSLGKLSIRSRNELDEVVFDKIKLNGKQINLDIQGQTVNKLSDPMTHMHGKVSIKDSGKLLKQLDYYNGLDKAASEFDGYLKWHGSLLSFSIKNLFGKIKFKFNQGSLSEVNPGIGRIIGIINLNHIIKRIDLNFKNASNQGFEFETIQGNLLFNQSNLYTRDIKLESSIAKVNINGYIDLTNKTCHHSLAITPDISTSLPYAGLAIAGPAGAAIGFLGQKVLGTQLNKISQYKYDLSGLCEDPLITNKDFTDKTLIDN